MEIDSSESLILKLLNIKLSDTFDTFGGEAKIVNGNNYVPLSTVNTEKYYISHNIVSGDARMGVHIFNGNSDINYLYGANRACSNASSIAVGLKKTKNYYFLSESFRDIYDDSPELTSRSICVVNSLYSNEFLYKKLLYYFYNQKLSSVNKKDLILFQQILARMLEMQDAFSTSNLNILQKTRKY